MSLLVPNTAEVILLGIMLNKITTDGSSPVIGGNRILRLFKNDVTPTVSTVLGDLTESTETGYAAVTLLGGSWTITTTSLITTAAYAKQTFTFDVAATVYGYYITATTGGELLAVERFSDGPKTLPSDGGNVGVTPRIKLKSTV